MNLESYETQINIAHKTLQSKVFECSKKINDNPDDYQSLIDLIGISFHSDQLDSALEFIENAFQIYPYSSELRTAKISTLLKLGHAVEAKNQIFEFIQHYRKDKNYRKYKDVFLFLSKIAEVVFNDFKLAYRLILISIKEFSDDYRGYLKKVLIEMYHYGKFNEGRIHLKKLIKKYNHINIVEAYILSYMKDNPKEGLKELKKLCLQYSNQKLPLVYLEYRLKSTFYDKKETLYFLDKNKEYINGNFYLYEKLCLGSLEKEDLIEENLERDYNNALFSFKYQVNLNSRQVHYKDFIRSLILLCKKKEFDKNYKEEVGLLKLAKTESFLNKYHSLPSRSFSVEDSMPLVKYKNQLNIKKKINEKKFKNYSVKPIFIIGLPRSGSTLVEKIIQNPKKIFDCDECAMVNRFVCDVDLSDNNSLYEIYCSNFSNLNKFKRFTDKTLHNFAFMDTIINIFPNAKFINCTRDIKENIIGIFKQQFDNLPWSHTIEGILQYTDEYLKLMDFFNKKYKNKIIDINHSDLVINKENETKKLFKFLGLKWSSNIFDFSSKKTFTNTSSKYQIKEKISKKFLNKYYHYYFILDEFRNKYPWLNS